MTTARRFVSLSILGASALALAPLASAQGFGGPRHMNNEHHTEIRTELEACREDNAGDREAMKTCADAVFEQYGIERPERPNRHARRMGHRHHAHIREELETCLELDDIDELKTCVREQIDN